MLARAGDSDDDAKDEDFRMESGESDSESVGSSDEEENGTPFQGKAADSTGAPSLRKGPCCESPSSCAKAYRTGHQGRLAQSNPFLNILSIEVICRRLLPFLHDEDICALESTCKFVYNAWDEAWRDRFCLEFPSKLMRYRLRRDGGPMKQVYFYSRQLLCKWVGKSASRFSAPDLAGSDSSRQLLPCTYTLLGHRASMSCVALSDTERDRHFSPPTLMVSGSARDRNIKVFNLAAGPSEPRNTFRDLSRGRRDGRASASGGNDNNNNNVVTGYYGSPRCLAVSGCFGDAVIASGGADGVIRVLTHRSDARLDLQSCLGIGRSVRCLAPAWDRSQLVSANELGVVRVSDLTTGNTVSRFKLADVVDNFSFAFGSSVGGFFVEGPFVYFTYHSGIYHWDLRQPPGTARALDVQGLGFQHISAERDGYKLLASCCDLDGVSTNGCSLVLCDRRALKKPIAKAVANQKICKVHIDSSKAFISSDHRHSISGGSTFTVFSNDLSRHAASLCTGLSFHGGGEATIDPFVVDVSDTVLVGANCTGSIVHVWDMEPAPAPKYMDFTYQDAFEPKQPLLVPKLLSPLPAASRLHANPISVGSRLSTPPVRSTSLAETSNQSSSVRPRNPSRRRSFSPTRNQGGIILF